ncbi:MAG TPA: efflux transporter outer membrane subunit [Verrucomicrobiae bacterium]|nr:efflux transporter outer membrane subunit [Verrucomicrobiae bacterium]
MSNGTQTSTPPVPNEQAVGHQNLDPASTIRLSEVRTDWKFLLHALTGAILAVVLVSCKVGPNYTTPMAKVAGHWTENLALTNRAYGTAEIYWWRNFDDPVMDRLIESAYSNNLSLQVAGARILETRAQLNRSIGNLFPQQQGIAGQVLYTRLNPGLVSILPGVNQNFVMDQFLFSATWEPDFWGKYRRGIESDRANYFVTIADYDNALITIISDVASSYVNIRTTEARLRVATQNVEIQKESLRIASARYKAGETGERDVQQATTQLAQTEANIPQLKESLAQSQNGLAVLLGETPDRVSQYLTGPSRIPTAPETVAAGIPKDLLRRRPDVQAAGLAAASKSALIGVARSQMYPSFSLTGQFGINGANQGSGSLSDIFNWQSRAINAAGSFFFPILNYGRLVNQVRVQDAQFQAAVLNYQNTVLSAQQEVENSLAFFTYAQQAASLLERAATASRRSTALAMTQYTGGQADYTTVLTAEQAQLGVEDSLVNTQGNVVLALISVYRALGGGWQLREGHDVIPEGVKAEMARRTDWGKLLEPARHLPGRAATTTAKIEP